MERRKQIINTLKIAKSFNAPENDTNTKYGFTCEDIDDILFYCKSEEIIKILNLAKDSLKKTLEKSPDVGKHVSRISFRDSLIDKLLVELGA